MLDPQANPVVLAPPAPAAEIGLAWLCFVVLLALAFVAIPALALAVRARLPRPLRAPVVLAPASFGHSPKVQRSPRHPVRMHRTLLATALLTLPALLLLLGVGALRREGIGVVEGALALTLPILCVTLHARRRSGGP
jgi:hypothetical protein